MFLSLHKQLFTILLCGSITNVFCSDNSTSGQPSTQPRLTYKHMIEQYYAQQYRRYLAQRPGLTPTQQENVRLSYATLAAREADRLDEFNSEWQSAYANLEAAVTAQISSAVNEAARVYQLVEKGQEQLSAKKAQLPQEAWEQLSEEHSIIKEKVSTALAASIKDLRNTVRSRLPVIDGQRLEAFNHEFPALGFCPRRAPQSASCRRTTPVTSRSHN